MLSPEEMLDTCAKASPLRLVPLHPTSLLKLQINIHTRSLYPGELSLTRAGGTRVGSVDSSH